MVSDFGKCAKVVALSEYNRKLRFPLLNEVEAYWEALRDGHPLPARDQIDPRGMERALEHAFILERVAPGVARFRLAGTQLTQLMGMDVRAMPLSALFTAEARDELARLMETLFDQTTVIRLSLSAERGLGKPGMDAAMLLLPLRDDTGQVTRALGCFVGEGVIGRAPRRFRIRDTVTRRPTERQTAETASPAPAFAEEAAPFAPAKRPDVLQHPALRLVASND